MRPVPHSPQEKIAYLKYLLALARQLAGHPEEATRAIREVAAERHDVTNARLVLDSDISNLEPARPEFATQLRKFRLSVRAK
jgi:hypothetical protein